MLTPNLSLAILKYIRSLRNVKDKKIICCYVYGLELSAKSSARRAAKLFEKKGKPEVINLFIAWLDVRNEVNLDRVITDAISNIS